MWEIRVEHIADWLVSQDSATLAGIYAALDMLQEKGPALGRPLVKNLKELRPASPGKTEVRILFAFDPNRKAIMLLGGDKSKGGAKRAWAAWYRKAIPEAEKRYRGYLQGKE